MPGGALMYQHIDADWIEGENSSVYKFGCGNIPLYIWFWHALISLLEYFCFWYTTCIISIERKEMKKKLKSVERFSDEGHSSEQCLSPNNFTGYFGSLLAQTN